MALRIPKFLSGPASLFGLLAAMSSFSCVSVDYPDIAFRCNPAKDGDAACPEGYICCSDDPAAYSVQDGVAFGVLPAYAGKPSASDPAAGVPMFSADNNSLSSVGMCIRDGLLDAAAGLIEPGGQGCPIPCNPTWGADAVASVCGGQSLCCQTVEVTESDCVQDSSNGCFRPVTGSQDIASGATNWGPGVHETAQDPGGLNCIEFAKGSSDPESVQNACYRALSVADSRGFCLQQSETVTRCPLTDPSYIDACEQLNLNAGRTDCPPT